MKATIANYGKVAHYAEVALALYLSWQYFSLWRSPSLDSAPELQVMIGIILFELFVLQSGLVVSVLPRWAAFLYLLVFIGGYALLFAQWIPGERIAVLYLFVLFNRGAYILSDREQHATRVWRWYTGIAYAFFIIVLVFAAFMSGSIPTLGLDERYLEISGYREWAMTDRGLLFERPHLGMFLGTAVYLGLSLLEVARIRKIGPFKQIKAT